MQFRLLGPLEVEDGERMLDISRPKQRALLAMLLLNTNRVVSTDSLVDALWEDHVPDTATKALQVHVSHLRRLLGATRLQTKAPGYVLRVEDGEYDVHEFEALVRKARMERPAQAHATRQRGLALWRGEPFAEFATHRFAQAEIARLHELRLVAIEGHLEAELGRGRAAELIGELESLVTEHPLRERFRSQLMLALYRTGRQAEALEAYRGACRVLREELGLEPSRELRDLERAILSQDPSLEPAPTEAAGNAGDSGQAAFVGREAELGELVAGLEEVFDGHGRLILLTGEPGIGKSRLADELIRRARERGADILVGRCWEAGGAPAYWPWVQSLRGYIRELDPALLRAELGTAAADIAPIVPELDAILPGLPEQPADPEGARFRLFDATTEFLRTASGRRPILLFLDDLHAADAPSLLLLQFLVRQLGSSGILVLGAYRSVDPVPGSPLRAMLAEVAREPTTRRVVLKGLTETDVAEYVELAAGRAASSEVVTALHEETEGNPLFMVEMVRLLAIEGGDLEPLSPGMPLDIPESIRDVITRRIAHLSAESNRVLVLASVLGREFAPAALARLAGVSEDDLLEQLDEAMAAGVLSHLPGSVDQVRFAHVLMRDTLYDGITVARRVRLHRLAVDALTDLYGSDPGAHLTELAHHSIAGSDFGRGLEFARRAADHALASLAYEEAARLYQVALDAAELSAAPGTTRGELLLAQGDAQILAGDGPAARKTLLRAAAIASSEGDADLFARAALAYGGRDIWGPRQEWDARYLPFLAEALAMCGDQDSLIRARLLTRMASAMRGDADRQRLESLTREASEIAQRLGDNSTVLFALDGRLAATGGPATAAMRFADGEKLVELATESGDLERVFGGHEHVANTAWTLGDRAALERTINAMRHLVQELNLQSFRSLVMVVDAQFAASQGRFREAEELITDAFRIGERAQSWNVQTPHRLQIFILRIQQDRLDGYEDVLRRSLEDYPGYSIFDCSLALAYAHFRRRDEAGAIFERLATHDFGRLSRDEDWLVNLSLLSEVCVYLDDRRRAHTMHALLTPFTHLNAVAAGEICLGSVARYAGRLATLLDLHEEAEAHFDTALEMNSRMGARPWLADTQADYAELLIRRAAPGDRERAQMLLNEAGRTFEELGMPRGAARAHELAAGEVNGAATPR
jgi:DNA-binding SARP family transcriptional activator/tetratricopeptide (TPR) repeat protein